MQVADAIQFLHASAAIVHRCISPPTLIIVAGGGWKLAGLALSAPQGFGGASGGSPGSTAPFDYHPRSYTPAQHFTQVGRGLEDLAG